MRSACAPSGRDCGLVIWCQALAECLAAWLGLCLSPYPRDRHVGDQDAPQQCPMNASNLSSKKDCPDLDTVEGKAEAEAMKARPYRELLGGGAEVVGQGASLLL